MSPYWLRRGRGNRSQKTAAGTITLAPTVTSITPNAGVVAGGTTITDLHGTGFINGATVTIGGVAATSVAFVSSSKLTCVSPGHAGGVTNVIVTNPDTQTSGTTGNGLYTYAVPNVTGISPSIGDTLGGEAITITGTGFTGATTASLGGAAMTSVVVVNDTTITGVSGARAAGANLIIQVDSIALVTGFTYWSPITPFAPTLFLEEPSYAVAAGTGTWTARVGTNMAESTNPPTATAGAPVFTTAGNSRLLSARTTNDLIGTSNAAGFTVAMVINIVTIPGVGETHFVIGDYDGSAIYWGIAWNHAMEPYLYVNDGGVKYAYTVNETFTTGRNVIYGRRAAGGALTFRINQNAWSPTTASSNIAGTGAVVYLGKNPVSAGVYKLAGKLQTITTAKAKWTDAECDLYYLWAAARHP